MIGCSHQSLMPDIPSLIERWDTQMNRRSASDDCFLNHDHAARALLTLLEEMLAHPAAARAFVLAKAERLIAPDRLLFFATAVAAELFSIYVRLHATFHEDPLTHDDLAAAARALLPGTDSQTSPHPSIPPAAPLP